MIAQGTFYKSEDEKPDQVQFVNWGSISGVPWDYEITDGRSNGDSAVSMTWREQMLKPGEERVYTTYYGLSEFMQDMQPPLAFSIAGAARLEVKDQDYSPNPFIVTAYIQNIGDGPAYNTRLEIAAEDGIELADGETGVKETGTLQVLDEASVSWELTAFPSPEDRTGIYAVSAEADHVETKVLAKEIFMPGMKAGKTEALGMYPISTGISCAVGDPVDIATGNYFTRHRDLLIEGRTALEFSRFYNALDTWEGKLGGKWHHNYEIRLSQKAAGRVSITYEDGHTERYAENDLGGWTGEAGNHKRLKRREDGGYQLLTKEKAAYLFDEDGLLTEYQDGKGNRTKLRYDEDWNLLEAGNRGGVIYFTYEDGLLTRITDTAGRNITYTYQDRMLHSVTDAEGNGTSYTYDEQGRLTDIFNNKNERLLHNRYDSSGRVIEQTMPDGVTCSFAYDDEERTAVHILP